VKSAWVVLAVAAAILLQTMLGRFVLRGAVIVDLVLVVVVYVALSAGPVTGLLAGAAAGLLQDALASGVIGVGGLSNTVVGFVVGVVGTQFIVAHSVPRFVVFLLATLLHAMIFVGLYALLDLRQFTAPFGSVAGQAFGNALVGVIAFNLAELRPGATERRPAARSRRWH
jgi:rod shape-determining protein MreD